MRIAAKGLGDDLLELGFDLVHRLSRREAGAVADAEDMGVDGERLLAVRGVEDDVGGLAADPGERLQLFARLRYLAIVTIDQRLAERDDVLRLGVEEADRLDCVAQALLAEVDHLPRGLYPLE
jgi:hypothetical protein